MNENSLLSYLVPDFEIPMFVLSTVVVTLGIVAMVWGLILARKSRKSKADSVKQTAKADAFSWSIRGLFGVGCGGAFVIAYFVPYNAASMLGVIVFFVIYFALTGLLIWRYMVADKNAIRARAFDRAVWHFFNG